MAKGIVSEFSILDRPYARPPKAHRRIRKTFCQKTVGADFPRSVNKHSSPSSRLPEKLPQLLVVKFAPNSGESARADSNARLELSRIEFAFAGNASLVAVRALQPEFIPEHLPRFIVQTKHLYCRPANRV